MRPLIDPRTNRKSEEPSLETKAMWDAAKRSNGIEYADEQTIFSLTEKEAEKCRFEITNMDQRLVECVVHRGDFSHGVKLHPPHLYELRKGKIFFKHEGQWVRWVANVAKNKERLLNLED